MTPTAPKVAAAPVIKKAAAPKVAAPAPAPAVVESPAPDEPVVRKSVDVTAASNPALASLLQEWADDDA
jgi:hypothetical protein